MCNGISIGYVISKFRDRVGREVYVCMFSSSLKNGHHRGVASVWSHMDGHAGEDGKINGGKEPFKASGGGLIQRKYDVNGKARGEMNL